MSFAATMIWMIGTATAVLLLLGLGFTAMAGALHLPKSWRRERRPHAGRTSQRGFHLRHGT